MLGQSNKMFVFKQSEILTWFQPSRYSELKQEEQQFKVSNVLQMYAS